MTSERRPQRGDVVFSRNASGGSRITAVQDNRSDRGRDDQRFVVLADLTTIKISRLRWHASYYFPGRGWWREVD